MKAIPTSLLACLLLCLAVVSCKKNPDATSPSSPAGNDQQELFARTLRVFDAGKSTTATLRFRSANKELLASMALDKFDFVLVNEGATPMVAPAPVNEQTTAMGGLALSAKGVNAVKNNRDELQASDSVVYVDLQSAVQTPSLSVEVRSKALRNPAAPIPVEETLYPNGTRLFFHGGTNWHRVQINNLSYYPLFVSFYYNSCDGQICSTNGDLKGTFTRYSGYGYTLYYNGWAYYYNCNRAVGALITISPNNGYWYRWTWWSACNP
ncbi:hypothetical protein V9K67_04970 [Paraflavisolibacter sp. H34]|uniref:hypothetical protein n=1 Tax=Huijunlia imazamoxiresistens TaxID=3127457 RepID=UPI00301B6914